MLAKQLGNYDIFKFYAHDWDADKGDFYESKEEAQGKHPAATILKGYRVIDRQTGVRPRKASIWYKTLDEAVKDILRFTTEETEEEARARTEAVLFLIKSKMRRAKDHYVQLEEIVKSHQGSFKELYHKLNGMNYDISEDETCFDCNYKSITVTIFEKDDFSRYLDREVEVYMDDEMDIAFGTTIERLKDGELFIRITKNTVDQLKHQLKQNN